MTDREKSFLIIGISIGLLIMGIIVLILLSQEPVIIQNQGAPLLPKNCFMNVTGELL